MRKKLMETVSNVMSKFIQKVQTIFKPHKEETPVQCCKKSDHYFEVSHKKVQVLQKLDKSIQKKRRQNQCDCLHQNEHGYDVRVEKRTDSEIIFTCRNCGKIIHMNRIPENKLIESMHVIDSLCDNIKMNLNLENKKDVDIANWISILQYRVLFSIFPLYAATQNRKSDENNAYGKTIEKRAD